MREPTSQVIILVVPCFNEEKRWIENYWKQVINIPDVKLYFVNDGSVDATSEAINLVIQNTSSSLIELSQNNGKAEAIRIGFLDALKEKPFGVGFLDADGAFDIDDVIRQISVFRKKVNSQSAFDAVWSSRVKLSGRFIDRKLRRHYLARILITLLSNRFRFSIYDTQSGLKIFVPSEILQRCINESFHTRWFIDLELFLRWRKITGSDMQIWEEPLLMWKDVGESKLSGFQYWNIVRDLWHLNRYK